MALADEIQDLSMRTSSALDASHDYYTYTKRVWRLVQQIAKEGRKFTFRNLTTGTKVDEQVLLDKAQLYVTDYLVSSTFQNFSTLFEDFLFDLLRLWLAAYPQRLSKKLIEFSTVLNTTDKTSIVLGVVDKELNELKYRRVTDWFEYLEGLVVQPATKLSSLRRSKRRETSWCITKGSQTQSTSKKPGAAHAITMVRSWKSPSTITARVGRPSERSSETSPKPLSGGPRTPADRRAKVETSAGQAFFANQNGFSGV